MMSQDQYYSTCVNNNISNHMLNKGFNASQLLSNTKSFVESKDGRFGEGVVINAGFSILPPGMMTPFKAKLCPAPTHKSWETGSARLSARITDFLKRSEHPFDERIPSNRIKSKTRNYSRENSIFSNSLSIISLSGSTDSLTSLDKSEAVSFADEDIMLDASVSTSGTANSSIEFQKVLSIENDELAQTKTESTQPSAMEMAQTENGRRIFVENCRKKSISGSSMSLGLTSLSSILGSKMLKAADFEMNFDEGRENFSTDKGLLKRSRQDLEAMKKQFLAKGKLFTDKLAIMRKALEKKCSEAVKEAVEQREIVSKLKRDLQTLQTNHADVKSLFQAETSKSTKLEARIRKTIEDQWKKNALLELEQVKMVELDKEKAEAVNQAEFLRTEFHRLKLDLHLKETKLSSIEAEMSELTQLRAEEAAQLNSFFQSKLKKQEEEYELLVDELTDAKAGKQKLDEQLEQLRRKHKLDIERHEQELEEFKSLTEKKLKGLEFQLTAAEDEKAVLLKSKKELEIKIFEQCVQSESQENISSAEEIERLRKELKLTRALLKHAEVMVAESNTADLNNKAIVRQLKNTLEQLDAEKCQLLRLRAKAVEEYQEKVHEIEDVVRNEEEVGVQNRKLHKENLGLQIGFENVSEELLDTQKKYQSTLEELAALKSSFSDQVTLTQALNQENGILQVRVQESIRKIKTLEEEQVETQSQTQKMLHLKQGQLRSIEKMGDITKRRYENQLEKLKFQLNSAQEDARNLLVDKKAAAELRKLTVKKQREATEMTKSLTFQLEEAKAMNAKLQKKLEISISESNSLKVKLKSTLQQVHEVKQAISGYNDESDDDTIPITD